LELALLSWKSCVHPWIFHVWPIKHVKYRENVIDNFKKTAVENMKMAAEAEKQLALERNETINGIPYIIVVADGT